MQPTLNQPTFKIGIRVLGVRKLLLKMKFKAVFERELYTVRYLPDMHLIIYFILHQRLILIVRACYSLETVKWEPVER